jgi:hypothetical protein
VPPASCKSLYFLMVVAFTAVTRVQIPSGTPNLFTKLQTLNGIFVGTKRHNSDRTATEVSV